MSKMIGFGTVMALVMASTLASAEVRPQDLERLAGQIPKVDPAPGYEAAKNGPPPWCAESSIEGSWAPYSIRIKEDDTMETFVQNARLVCLWPNEPVVQKAVGPLLQVYINWTGQSVANAIEGVKARVAKAHWDGDRAKLCGALKVSDEIGGGEEKEFMTARAKLFGCSNGVSPLWLEGGGFIDVTDDLLPYLDSSATEPDEAVRLGWLMTRTRYIFGSRADEPRELLGYVFDQFDLQNVSDAKTAALADAAPYKGNIFARTVLFESLGRAHAAQAKVGAAIKKLAADKDWNEILIAAPQRGAAAWDKAAAQYKDQLQRSAEFETKFWGPSRKAVAGCWPALRKDFVDMAKATKHTSATQFKEWLSEPVPSLLFSRLAACASVDQDPSYSNELLVIDSELRLSRGRRIAAYFAAFDALNEVLKDRERFPVTAHDFWFTASREINKAARRGVKTNKSKYDTMGWVMENGAGTVKAVKKVGDNVSVSFVTTHSQYMSTSCTQTNRIVMFDSGGAPIYYQSCKDTGMVTYNNTPEDIQIPAEWAEGIKAGAVVEYSAARGKERVSLPRAVYADKNKKVLVGFYGLPI